MLLRKTVLTNASLKTYVIYLQLPNGWPVGKKFHIAQDSRREPIHQVVTLPFRGKILTPHSYGDYLRALKNTWKEIGAFKPCVLPISSCLRIDRTTQRFENVF